MGHPGYQVTGGRIELNGQDVLAMEPHERARAGLFLAFQRPVSIPGVRMADFLRHAATNIRHPERKEGEDLIPMRQFRKELSEKMRELRIDPEFAKRYVNEGFSGGEMKRAEILQMAVLRPKFAILDETDSGLDVDAVRLASQSIAEIGGHEMGILIITHHEQLLEHNPPDFTHVMLGGRIVEAGGPELAAELHKQGYDRIRAAHPEAAADEAAMLEKSLPLQTANRKVRTLLIILDIACRIAKQLKYNEQQPAVNDRRRTRYNTSWLQIFAILSSDPIGEINKYDFRNEEKYVFKARKGLNREVVAEISEMKGEPAWMREFRLKALEIFYSKPHAALGREYRHQLRRDLLLYETHRGSGEILGRGARGNQIHLR